MPDLRSRVATGLASWLGGRGVDADVVVLDRAVGGLSQETWMVRIMLAGDPVEAVLRLPTAASGSRSIPIQRAALQSVAPSPVRAPELLWFDDSEATPFERPFIVMARAPGDVPVGWHTIAEPARTALAGQAIDMLAALHTIDVDATPLATVAPSPLMTLAGLERLFTRLAPVPAQIMAAIWWLRETEPSHDGRSVIVHGDYRMGNMTVDRGAITGVLDWEMTAPGDPLVDLAWCFIPVWEPALVDEAGLIDRYAAACGRSVDAEVLRWHRCLGFLRLAYYALAGARAFDTGRSDDLRLAALRLQLPVHVDRLAATMAGEPVT